MRLFKIIKWDTLLTGVLYILLGIVSIFFPVTMGKILGFLLGTVLILAGAVSMISYLLRDAHQNYYHNDFFHGLVGIVLGIFVLYKANVKFFFTFLPILLGILVLVSGLSKLQDAIDFKRMEYGNWVVMLVLAVLNIVLGLVLLSNPVQTAEFLFSLLGIGLIFSGVTDCATTLYFAKKIKDYLAGLNAVDSTFVEVVDEEKGKRGKRGKKEAPVSDPGKGSVETESKETKE